MLDYYEKLLKLKCFSPADAVSCFGDERKTANILYALKKKVLVIAEVSRPQRFSYLGSFLRPPSTINSIHHPKNHQL